MVMGASGSASPRGGPGAGTMSGRSRGAMAAARPVDEVDESDVVVVMPTDREPVGRDADRAGRVEARGVDAERGVAQVGAEDQQAVALLDVPARDLVAERALVDAQEQGVRLVDDALAQGRHGDRDAGPVDEGGQVVVDAEARQLLAREDDRLPGRRQEGGGLGEGLGEGGLVRHLGLVADRDGLDAAVDLVARQLQVDRPPVLHSRRPASGRWCAAHSPRR